ncbi:gas vesicle protein GvpJ [Nocardiopsis endophytica]
MTTTQQTQGGGHSGGLYEVVDLILDKGLVIDVFARVSLVGIEILTVDVRVVVASVDTYLRFAEAANRLDLTAGGAPQGLPGLVGGLAGGSSGQEGARTDGHALSDAELPQVESAEQHVDADQALAGAAGGGQEQHSGAEAETAEAETTREGAEEGAGRDSGEGRGGRTGSRSGGSGGKKGTGR